MTYDFDRHIDRRGTGALKYDALQERYGDASLLPLWVADMDFATSPFIIDALRSRLDHPVMGYTVEPADYRRSIIDWLRELHGVEVRPEWISYIPGIVKGIGLAINCFTEPGDKVVIMPPVYHPFRMVPEANGRQVVWNPLRELPGGRYEIDFDNLEKVCADQSCRMLILSSPHNPAGIAWGPDTLRRLADLCTASGIMVISDEIHSEMLLHGRKHEPFYAVSESARCNSITFAAPSKTFNIAGIVSSYAIVPDDSLRRRFYGFLNASELDEPPLFSPLATIAAYREGAEWRRQMLEYVEGNIAAVCGFCAAHMPRIKALEPDASFLVWLDCRGLQMNHEELNDFFCRECRLALNDGEMFGPGGRGFMRLNVGAPRALIMDALERISAAYNRLNY